MSISQGLWFKSILLQTNNKLGESEEQGADMVMCDDTICDTTCPATASCCVVVGKIIRGQVNYDRPSMYIIYRWIRRGAFGSLA